MRGSGSRRESVPPDTWTESGQTPILRRSLLVAAGSGTLSCRLRRQRCQRRLVVTWLAS
jgi:hypothetical protein